MSTRLKKMCKTLKKNLPIKLFLYIAVILLIPMHTVSGGSFDAGLIKNGQAVNVFLDNTKISFEVEPVVVDGRTLVPMRAIFELLKADINWDHLTQTATAKQANREVIIVRDSNTAYVDGQAVVLDVAARTVNSRMMVPLRFVSETLGLEVQWTEKDQRIDLFTKDNSSADNANHASNLTGRIAFGLNPPTGLAFTTADYFLNNVKSIFYNIVLDFEAQPLNLVIRTLVWHPDGNILLDKTDAPIQLSGTASSFRTDGEIKYNDVSHRFEKENQRNNLWDTGYYRVDIWINDERIVSKQFNVMTAINNIGNTSANIYNKGLVTEQGKLIYYVGDDGGLYKEEIGSSDIVKLTEDKAIYLNTQGQWVYFVNSSKDNVISRIRFDGKTETGGSNPYYVIKGQPETINHDETGQLLLVDDWLYFVNISDGNKLYRINTDGNDKQVVLNEPIQSFYVEGNILVYLTYDEHYREYSQRINKENYGNRIDRDEHLILENDFVLGRLYAVNLTNLQKPQQLVSDHIVGMIVKDGWAYYLRPKNVSWNTRVSGRIVSELYRVPININYMIYEPELVIKREVMNYYVSDEYILIQDNANRGRIWYKYALDGKQLSEIDTEVIRKLFTIADNVMLNNRTTFPLTYMNGSYNGIHYYVGNESEHIGDVIPYRNDKVKKNF